VDIEAEAQPRPDIGERLADYAARAKVVTGLKVISVVLWLNAGGAPPPSPYEDRLADPLLGTRHFFGVAVYQLPAEMLLARGHAGLIPLVPFTPEGGDPAMIERAARAIKERVSAATEVQELESLLTVFASRTIGEAQATDIIRRLFMSTEILETSPIYQRLVEQGREEGREQGREEGVRAAVLLVLRGRFDPLPFEVERAVGAASRAALEDTLRHAASEDLERIQARLNG